MKITILTITLFIICLNTYATEVDTTIFNSEAEKAVFLKLLNSEEVDVLEIFLLEGYSSEENQSIKTKLNEYINKLNTPKIKQKGIEDQLKLIHKSLYLDFLRKQVEYSRFGDIFSSGDYDFVTTSALYSQVLNGFGIRYSIKDDGSRIYIIADAEKSSFLIETNSGSSEIVVLDDRLKKKLVAQMHDTRQIPDNEFNSESLDYLFQKYCNTDKTITQKELAGLHYYNQGKLLHGKENYTEALKCFEKAEILYPSEKVKSMINICLEYILNDEAVKKIYSGKNLAKYVNSDPENSNTLEYSQQYYNNTARELIINHSDPEGFAAFNTEFLLHLDTLVDYRVFKVMNLMYLAQFNYYKLRYSMALNNIGEAYLLNPENEGIRQLVSELVIKSFLNEQSQKINVDSIEYYCKKFEFLYNDDAIQKIILFSYFRDVEIAYELNKPDFANTVIGKFEAFVKRNPKLQIADVYAENIFSTASSYYVRKQNYTMAKDMLNRGLQIFPNSSDLKFRLETINKSLEDPFYYTEEVHPEFDTDYLKTIANISTIKELINQEVHKYIVGKWKSYKFIDEGVTLDLDDFGVFTLSFNDNNTAELIGDNEKSSGKWRYNNLNCTLTISNKENSNIDIIITSITNTELKGLMYFEGDISDSVEVVFRAVE
jgi:tetratricopeptide (TPR) repeat protein